MAKPKTEPWSPRLKKPATLDHLKKKEPLETSVPILLSDAPIEAVEAARSRVLRAEGNLAESPDDSGLQREMAAAQNDLDEALEAQNEEVVWCRFRSIGRKAYDRLIDEHPPTDKQKEEAAEAGNPAPYNGETFAPALVAASCVEPKMTVEDAKEIFEEWNQSESFSLFMAAMRVCTGRRVSDLGNGSGGTFG